MKLYNYFIYLSDLIGICPVMEPLSNWPGTPFLLTVHFTTRVLNPLTQPRIRVICWKAHCWTGFKIILIIYVPPNQMKIKLSVYLLFLGIPPNSIHEVYPCLHFLSTFTIYLAPSEFLVCLPGSSVQFSLVHILLFLTFTYICRTLHNCATLL